MAIATPPGAGALGVIRVSGPQAIPVVSSLVRLGSSGRLEEAAPRTLHRVSVVDPESGEDLDVAVVATMPGPHSYTGEDVVELFCHGNPLLLGEIVGAMIRTGARLAAPGEFTERAFLSGHLDLVQAESVAALIGARSERAARLVARQLRGSLSEEIGRIRERLLDLMAGLEVTLDFPDEGVGTSRAAASKEVDELAASVGRLLARAERGRPLQEGLMVMLAGAPNVGKSSVLNALLGTERAIVSPSPGTTRDLVEAGLAIEGVPVRLVDGAGLGRPRDEVDAEGMRRARQAISDCDLVVVVLDRSRAIDADDREVLEITAGQRRIMIANKVDLPSRWPEAVPWELECSATTGRGIDALRQSLARWIRERTGDDAEEGGVVVSVRVREQLGRARAALACAAEGQEHTPLEAVLVDLREANRMLGQTIGIGIDDEILGRIFAEFCVGK